MAGPYLSDAQLERISEDLAVEWIMSERLSGRAWEERLAEALGTTVATRGGNRPVPDLADGTAVKQRGVRATDLAALRGDGIEVIMSRMPVESRLRPGERLRQVCPDRFGALCLGYYNDIVTGNGWSRISFLLRGEPDGQRRQFLYWEAPAATYEPGDYRWRDTGRAAGQDRNLAGHHRDVQAAPDGRLPRPSFSWTSRGKQFYIRHRIPEDAQLIEIRRSLSRAEATALIRAGAAAAGRPLA